MVPIAPSRIRMREAAQRIHHPDYEEPVPFVLDLHDFQLVEGAKRPLCHRIGWIMGRHEFLSGGDADT
jgi:hypothetical protein